MKRLLIVIGIIMSLSSYGQRQLGKLTYEQTQTSSIFVRIKNNTKIFKYIAANGAVMEIGDTLIIGTPSGSETNTYAVGAGSNVYGAVAKSNTKKSFSNIIMGKPAGLGNIINAANGDPFTYASANMQGEIVVIADMKAYHKGSRKKPLRLLVLLGEPNGRAFGINKYMSVKDFEKAVLAGEIRALHAPMTRREAISKLKEAKELLDLGVMDAQEYEKLKKEMVKIIRPNKM